MANACPGCFLTGRELQAQYESIVQKATEYSKENKIDVAIYREIDGYYYIDANTAVINNYPIKEIITYSV